MTSDPTWPDTAANGPPRDEANARAPNPKRRFSSPELLVADAKLADMEKYALLQEWSLEIDNRLRAEEEGMSAQDPIHSGIEAKLADEAARIRSHLSDYAEKVGEK